MCLFLGKRAMLFRKQKREWVVATRLGSMHLGEMIHFCPTPVMNGDVSKQVKLLFTYNLITMQKWPRKSFI